MKNKMIVILSIFMIAVSIFCSNSLGYSTSIVFDNYDFSSAYDLADGHYFFIVYEGGSKRYTLFVSTLSNDDTNFLYKNGKVGIVSNDGVEQRCVYAYYDTDTQKFGDLMYGNWTFSTFQSSSKIVYSSLNIYTSLEKNEIFFQVSPPTVLEQVMEVEMTEKKTIQEILGVLPLTIVVVVSFLGLRKALRMLVTFLRRS